MKHRGQENKLNDTTIVSQIQNDIRHSKKLHIDFVSSKSMKCKLKNIIKGHKRDIMTNIFHKS